MADPVRRLTVTLLGTTVLDIVLGPAPTPTAEQRQPDDEAPGPVTDRRSSPALGFGTRSGRGVVKAEQR